MTTATLALASKAYQSLPSLPITNPNEIIKNISSIAIPVIAMVAIANLPTAAAWFGSNDEAFTACIDACDGVEEEARILCCALCWIFT